MGCEHEFIFDVGLEKRNENDYRIFVRSIKCTKCQGIFIFNTDTPPTLCKTDCCVYLPLKQCTNSRRLQNE